MLKDIFVVTVPQLGVNEEMATLVEWYISDEKIVTEGELLYSLETMKTVFDATAEAKGFLLRIVEEGVEVKVNQPIALIGPDIEALKLKEKRFITQNKISIATNGNGSESTNATQKARNLAKRLGVDISLIPGEGIIREKDIIKYQEVNFQNNEDRKIELFWNPSREPVVIYGAGKGAATLKESIFFNKSSQVVCFVDDDSMHPKTLCGLPVYHSSKLNEIVEKGVNNIGCEIANGKIRLKIFKKCQNMGINLINVIHPHTYISPTASMKKGNFIKAGAIIETNTKIGNCCIIDNGVNIAHDNVISDGCHIAPGASLGSNIYVGDLAIIGIGASIATGVRIGRSSIISVGSSVVKDVPEYAIVEGIPGKVVGKCKKR